MLANPTTMPSTLYECNYYLHHTFSRRLSKGLRELVLYVLSMIDLRKSAFHRTKAGGNLIASKIPLIFHWYCCQRRFTQQYSAHWCLIYVSSETLGSKPFYSLSHVYWKFEFPEVRCKLLHLISGQHLTKYYIREPWHVKQINGQQRKNIPVTGFISHTIKIDVGIDNASIMASLKFLFLLPNQLLHKSPYFHQK